MQYKKYNIIPELFASIIAVVAGVLIYISRIGFDNYGFLIIKSVFISFFLINTPCIINVNIAKKIPKEWYFSKAFILFICIILLVLAGQASIILDIDLSLLFTLLGGVIFVFTITFNSSNTKISGFVYMIFFLLGVWTISAYCINYYHHPLFKEKIITGAWAHRDTLWYASMAGMFKTYATSSTGLDGLVPFYFHTLSSFLYGSISGLLGINTLTFINIIVPILIIPIFFLAFLFCVKDVSKYYSVKLNIKRIDEENIKYWILFSVLFVLPLPYQILGHVGLGRERYHYLISHSYLVALLLSFIFLSLIFTFVNVHKEEEKFFTSNKIFFVGTIVLLYLAITLSKTSFLFVIGSIYGYVFLRLKYFLNIYHIWAMFGFIVVVAFDYLFIINTETLLKNPYQAVSEDISPLSYIFYILPSLIYICLKLYSLNIRSIQNIYEKIKNAEISDIEILVLLIIILYPLPFQFFKGIQIYLAYILILSHLNLFIHSFFSKDSHPVKR